MEEALPELPRPRKPAAALARVKVAPALQLYLEVWYSKMEEEHYFRRHTVNLAAACAETSGRTAVPENRGLSYPLFAMVRSLIS